ncbi:MULTISPECIES: hypothetical protein [unclassified Sulfuricurvum]|uniref:hypothetical protein n=1 Tax=unclassified Sulfuricurvum TaxID=2632390 RepID=UPI0002997AC1|nr:MULTISPECIES: hypothetical protein [unclassified Sulfuricurvum]OHD82741.1 MAG: hypothetical protein A3D90_07255 [Sulfuricurvum sp. RIFCSPHIGHO2_02_FULL_43_9]OHD85749.1 MAG: hypothetical protein A3I60_03645 [Sulfuricurvum sp. RIFCSPLOWO2_02_FULL_43_45]OHD87070.1 MAG: hypothetical protein A2Y52_10720 [Sulfuricurvum sp. RIFCSPLOWO2_02_43_6]OHD88592.1 MAG: hypothetical protein A3J39_06960 [Sulfuricurvum sp. RIFCSPHIGHO2_12_FULL_44_8]AFV97262.1 hypothetical protein B649_04740 [Candidatus Sulfuri
MQLKRYTIASLILMILVGAAVYSIDNESISFDLLGMHFPNLPVAFWVVVPLIIMYLASLLHMGVYALVGNFKLRRLNKDHEKMIDALRDSLLGVNERNYVYKSDAYKLMGKLIDNALILPYETLRSVGNEKIDEALELMRDVKEKKKVDIKKFHLSSTTSIAIQNNLNRFERGEMDADSVLSRPDSYGEIVCAKAYASYVKTASVGSVMKFKHLFTKASLIDFVQRINAAENGIQITNEELATIFSSLKLDSNDWIDISAGMSKNMLPEQRIRLFEVLSENNDEAMEGYLYTLYDLQMIDTANEILNNTSNNDYQIFKAYRDLKRANKHYDIAIFLRRNC